MEWQMIAALVVAMLVILFPAAFVWYVNFGGIVRTIRDARSAAEKKTGTAAAR